MKYDPLSKAVLVKVNQIELAYHHAVYAIHKIRELAGLPMRGYHETNALKRTDRESTGANAERTVLDIMEGIGVAMRSDDSYGVAAGVLDVRNENEKREDGEKGTVKA
jgi:hypothetical protein